jgi:hypothetical protein
MAKNNQLDPYYERMRPLGELRCRVINCTGSNMPKSKFYFDPSPSIDVEEALHRHLLQLWESCLPEERVNEFNGMAVIAAGLLTFGDLSRLNYILEHVPPHRIELDHGCGYCNVLAVRIVARLLPLPKELPLCSLWIQGSQEVEEVKQWIHEHRSRLVWNPDSMKFDLLTVA